MPHQRLIAVYLAQRDDLIAYVHAIIADHELAEDVVQDVGLRLVERTDIPFPDNPAGWLRTLCRNRLLDELRSSKRRLNRHAPVESFATLAEAAEAAFADNSDDPLADRHRLAACLDRLSPRARELIQLRYYQEGSLESVAAAMSWTTEAVKSGLAKARRALADCLRRRGGAHGP